MDYIQIIEKVRKFFSGNSSKNDDIALSRSVGNTDFDEAMLQAWEETDDVIEPELADEIWEQLECSIKNSKPSRIVPRWRFSLLKAAAVAAAVIFVAYVGISFAQNYFRIIEQSQMSPFYVEVEKGQKAQLRLADGTQVWLNSGSRISYGSDYNKNERVVNLEGEAFFDVASNPDKRFYVKCNDLSIEALGTKFNVKAYENDGMVTTTLAQGKVLVSSPTDSVILRPMDVALYDLKCSTLRTDSVDNISVADFWRSDKMVFDGESFESMCRVLERMYGVSIVIKDDKLCDMHFSGTLCNNSLSNIFHLISLAYPISYTINNDTVWISAEN